MENASKALLIAAAILIVIVLIAFGVSVLNSSEGVGDQATDVGGALKNQTNGATSDAMEAMGYQWNATLNGGNGAWEKK